MVSFTSIVAKTQRVKGMHIENTEYITEEVHTNGEVFERGTIIAHVRPFKRLAHQCPCCRETRPIYDHKAKDEVYWRGADWNGARILLAGASSASAWMKPATRRVISTSQLCMTWTEIA